MQLSVSSYCRVSDIVRKEKMYQYLHKSLLSKYIYCGKGGKGTTFVSICFQSNWFLSIQACQGSILWLVPLGFFFSCPSSFHPPIRLKTRQARSSIIEQQTFWSQIGILTELITKKKPLFENSDLLNQKCTDKNIFKDSY